jgi:hypothetical protein
MGLFVLSTIFQGSVYSVIRGNVYLYTWKKIFRIAKIAWKNIGTDLESVYVSVRNELYVEHFSSIRKTSKGRHSSWPAFA